jgi:hypothetical protein
MMSGLEKYLYYLWWAAAATRESAATVLFFLVEIPSSPFPQGR